MLNSWIDSVRVTVRLAVLEAHVSVKSAGRSYSQGGADQEVQAMQMRTIMVGAFAVIFGVVSAIGAFMTKRNSAPAQKTVSVVTAAEDLAWGTLLEKQHLVTRDYLEGTVPAGAVTTIEDAVGRTNRENLVAGQALIASRLTEPGAGRGLPPLIPKGMRAVSIQTPTVSSGVSGFVMPGNKVDVVLTMYGQNRNDSSGGGRTLTLLQNVSVLAVDQNIEAPSENKMDLKQMRTVTLVVSPIQAQELDLGQNRGVLRLTLRNPNDELIEDVPPVTVTSLTSGERDLTEAAATSDITGAGSATADSTETEDASKAVMFTTAQPTVKPRRPFTLLVTRGTSVSQINMRPAATSDPPPSDSDMEAPDEPDTTVLAAAIVPAPTSAVD